jgi:subtilisin family serine protease
MPLRFIGPAGGSTSDAVSAIEYAVAQGARVSSNSWGGGGFSLSLYNAVSAARAIGHVFVAAAGNNGVNTDSSPFYPAAFNLDNVLSVAATDYRDNLAGWSNYGVKTVDVGAPGVNIYSTYKGSGYAWLSGTSMAAPHVAGLVALVQEQHSGWDYPQVINQVLATVRPVASLDGKTKTGGVINALAALGGGTTPTVPSPPPASDTPPAAPSGLQATVDQTIGLVTLNWNDESDNETGFQVQREKYNSKRRKWAGTRLLTSVGADVTQATDSPGDGDFRYQARAYNDAGSSAWTDWVEVNVATTGGGGPSTKPCRGKKCR